ncbi:hypothetical protein [Haladaptatus sp. ZSTT2]|uniref:hypothetical protein n=1 Tax=Haladaptatus sp. ZSTT2 TaxID=3120515 RepID=UPI00300EF930
MKSGAGDDPFADIFEDDTLDDGQPADADSVEGGSTEESDVLDVSKNDSPHATDEPAGKAEEPADEAEIPWIFRRDKVKADREKVHQLFVRPETDRTYRRFESDLEEAMDTDLSRLDVREAAYLVGMQHPEMVISLLESWGYNYFD